MYLCRASRAGFATFSDFSGIATFANIAGVATISGFSTNSHRAGFATFSDFDGISTFATTAGFALTAGLSTNTNFIDVDSTDANSSHPITLIDSTNTGTFHKLKIDASGGLLFNPSDNLLSVGEVSIAGIVTVGGATTVYSTLDVFQ